VRGRLLAIAFILFLLVVPTALAIERHTVRGDLHSFADAFRSLFYGSPEGFIDGILDALPLFGLIIVVYGLVYFICVLTLFKDKDHHRYGNMIAIGIALLGIAQQSVYNAILSWSTTFLIITFLLAVIFMIIMFINTGRRRHFEVNKDMFDSKKSFLTSKREVKKLSHELHEDSEHIKRTERDLKHVDRALDNFDTFAKDELHLVKEIEKLLDLVGAPGEGEHAYVSALRNHVWALVNQVSREDHLYRPLIDYLDDAKMQLKSWGYDVTNEIGDETTLESILHKHLDKKGHAVDKNDIADFVESNAKVKKILHNLKHSFRELIRIFNRFESEFEKDIVHKGFGAKHGLATDIRDSVLDSDYKSAREKLGKFRTLLGHEKHILRDLHSLESTLHSQLGRVERLERELGDHFADIKTGLGL
jgi:large-conductance mechanosensitive channel